MIAVDTNIIVRLLTQDHPEQFAKAEAIFSSYEQIFLGTAVLLECEWVLRSLYKFSKVDATDALRKLCGLSNVVLENGQIVAQALQWREIGLEFADALHLAAATKIGRCDRLATFDKKLQKLTVNTSDIEVFIP